MTPTGRDDAGDLPRVRAARELRRPQPGAERRRDVHLPGAAPRRTRSPTTGSWKVGCAGRSSPARTRGSGCTSRRRTCTSCSAATARCTRLIDGKPAGTINVDAQRLYTVRSSTDAEDGLLELRFTPGVAGVLVHVRLASRTTRGRRRRRRARSRARAGSASARRRSRRPTADRPRRPARRRGARAPGRTPRSPRRSRRPR